MKPALLVLALGLAACTSPPAPGMASAGKTCIVPQRIQKQEIVSDSVIKFTMNNGEVWTNTMKSPCNGLTSERAFRWNLTGNSACSNEELIHLDELGTTCAIGEFVRVSGPTTSG